MLDDRDFVRIIGQGAVLNPDTLPFESLFLLGKAYEGAARPGEAYRFYRSCLERDSSSRELLFSLADLCTEMGRRDEAREYLRSILAGDGSHFYARLQLARLELRSGNYERAAEGFSGLLAEDSANSFLWYGLAECHAGKKESVRAAVLFLKAYALNRSHETMAVRAIASLIDRGAAARNVIDLCDTALYYLPGNPRILRSKGVALYGAGRYAEAETVFEGLLGAGDSTLTVLRYGGVTAALNGHYAAAVRLLERAYGEDSLDVMSNLTLASALTQTGETAAAFRMLDRVERGLRPDPLSVRLLTEYRGEAFRRSGDSRAAAGCFYTAYLGDTARLDLLNRIVGSFPSWPEIADDASREIVLFAAVTFVREWLERGFAPSALYDYRSLLNGCSEELFFRGGDRLRMRSPRGEAAKISARELSGLIARIPPRE